MLSSKFIQSVFQVDLDDITTKSIRLRLEEDLNEKFDELKVGELPNAIESIIISLEIIFD